MLQKNTENLQRFYLPKEKSILRRRGAIFVDVFRAANFPAFGITLQASNSTKASDTYEETLLGARIARPPTRCSPGCQGLFHTDMRGNHERYVEQLSKRPPRAPSSEPETKWLIDRMGDDNPHDCLSRCGRSRVIEKVEAREKHRANKSANEKLNAETRARQ